MNKSQEESLYLYITELSVDSQANFVKILRFIPHLNRVCRELGDSNAIVYLNCLLLILQMFLTKYEEKRDMITQSARLLIADCL